MHKLAGSKAPLPKDLDGVNLRSVLKKGNDGKLPTRDTGLVFHFPAYYTIPITSYRDGDYKLMRHLNTGEIKLFDVAKDMGETKDLSKSMPEKKMTMVRKLDAYLKKVGAWTMEEVYATRIEELEKWIAKHHEDIAEFNRKLEDDPKNKKIQAGLTKAQNDLVRHQRTFGQVSANKTSDRWF
jgi:hypothetical protein